MENMDKDKADANMNIHRMLAYTMSYIYSEPWQKTFIGQHTEVVESAEIKPAELNAVNNI